MSFINITHIVIHINRQNPYSVKSKQKDRKLCGQGESNSRLILGKDVFYH